jgi:hypothetical protein
MESMVKVREEGERVVVLAEHQVVRFWGSWNPRGYPVEHDHL